jgi:hypothetical protein
MIFQFGALAQLVARLHGMEEVVGSNPTCSTKELFLHHGIRAAEKKYTHRILLNMWDAPHRQHSWSIILSEFTQTQPQQKANYWSGHSEAHATYICGVMISRRRRYRGCAPSKPVCGMKMSSLSEDRIKDLRITKQIHHLVQTIDNHNQAWRRWFQRSKIVPHEILYEGLDMDPVGVAQKALKFLGLDLPPERTIRVQDTKMADELNEQWVAGYRASASLE